MWRRVVIVILMVSLCQSFNVDTFEPVIRTTIQTDFSADLVNRDLFGYRVALYPNRSIIVGAPKGSHTTPPTNSNPTRYDLPYGVVYNCPVDPGPCQGLTGTGDFSGRLYDNTDNANDEQKNGQFMGGTIRARESGLLVCAPRYIRINGDVRHPIGWCVYTYDLATFYPPDSSTGIRWCDRNIGDHLDRSVCGLGSGGDIVGTRDFISQGGFDNGISVGAPGNLNWAGGIREYTGDTGSRGFSRSFGRGRVDNSTDDAHNAMMGYDLVFFYNDSSLPTVLASAPRYNQLRGRATAYENFVTFTPRNLTEIDGDEVGSLFGASLASVDLNGDGRDEVVVGAPTYSDPQRGLFEIGQIHIYLNNGNFTLLRTITGTQPYAQFGYAVSGLGDIDDNGLGDFVVGAPFGEGPGTVYIYSGVGGDEVVRLTQTIVGNSLNVAGGLANLRSFGSSLSNSVDVDGNGYPDIAVGAFMSQQVFLLRSRPVANVTVTFTPTTITSINLDATSNTMFSVCLQYTGQSLQNTLAVNYRFVLERQNAENGLLSRAVFQTGSSNERSGTYSLLNDASPQCVGVTIHFTGSNEGDVYTPVTVDLIFSLAEPNMTPTDGNQALSDLNTRPVLRVVGDTSIRIPLLKDCGADNMCAADLQLDVMNDIVFELTVSLEWSSFIYTPKFGKNNSTVLLCVLAPAKAAYRAYRLTGAQKKVEREGKSLQPRRDNTIVTNLDTVAAGVVTAVQIPVRLNNTASEPAVAPVISLLVPNIVGFISAFQSGSGQLAYICNTISNSSSDMEVQVECGIGVVLLANSAIDLIFRIQTRNIIGSEGNFTITFNSSSSSGEVNFSDNGDVVTVGVSAEADVFVQSSFRPDSVEIGTFQADGSGTITDLGPMTQGQFVVRNSGPSAIPFVQLIITWPSHDGDEGFLYPHRIEGDSDDVSCSEANLNPRGLSSRRRKRQSSGNAGGQVISCADDDDEQHVSCVEIKCNISNLRANESSTIRVNGYVVDETFTDTSEERMFVVRAFANITADFITQPDDHAEDSSTATLLGVPSNVGGGSDDGVEAWVIIVPIIVAIIIIVAAAILLRFFGFFKRKKVNKGVRDENDNWQLQSPENTTIDKGVRDENDNWQLRSPENSTIDKGVRDENDNWQLRSPENTMIDKGVQDENDNWQLRSPENTSSPTDNATLPTEQVSSEEPSTRRFSNADI